MKSAASSRISTVASPNSYSTDGAELKDRNLSRRAQELEKRLAEQSRSLEENYLERKNLRGEIASVRKAEADLRSEIDARVNIATKDLKAEKEKLQAALVRANGERVRLAYELANINGRLKIPGLLSAFRIQC